MHSLQMCGVCSALLTASSTIAGECILLLNGKAHQSPPYTDVILSVGGTGGNGMSVGR